MDDWNFHPLSSAGNRSPLQLIMHGTELEGMHINTYESFVIDEKAPLSDIDSGNDVIVPETRVQLTGYQLQILLQAIDPIRNDGNQSIDVYAQEAQVLSEMLDKNLQTM